MTPKEFLEHALDNVNNGRRIGHGLLYGSEPSEAACLHQIDFTRLGDSYSIASKSHVVNGFTVPAPLDIAPKKDQVYFSPDHFSVTRYSAELWADHEVDHLAFLNKQAFATKEASIANQKAQAFINPNL